MSGRMKGTVSSMNFSETAANQGGSSMHFWGMCFISGKHYAHVVGQRFRITMAVLDPKSFQNDSSENIVSLFVHRGDTEYLLCVLKHGKIHQVNLNLIFDKGENVRFYIHGQGKVYVSGYQLTDSEDDVMNDENGYLCPLVEVTPSSPLDTIEPVASTSKMNKNEVTKPLWSSYLNETVDDEEESESDEDFAVSDEESDDEEISSDIEPEELEDITRDLLESNDDDSDVEEIQNFNDSRKRRRLEKSPSQKRSRNDSQNFSASVDNAEDIIFIEDNGFGEKDTSFSVKNSTSSTPIPEKHGNSKTPFSEKKFKKEKQLREVIKNINCEKKENAETSSTSKSLISPKSPLTADENSSKIKYPTQKLKGGVEIQDVTIGKGPEAAKGKVVSIFFVGRLPNNEVFDSRVPGHKPFSFLMGGKQVIKGWEIAIKGMKVGGRRKMIIPPKMAYGAVGNNKIPAGSTLRFVVDLQSVS